MDITVHFTMQVAIHFLPARSKVDTIYTSQTAQSTIRVSDMPWRIHNMAELIYAKGCVQWRGIHYHITMYKHGSYATPWAADLSSLYTTLPVSSWDRHKLHSLAVSHSNRLLPFSSERSPHKQHGCAHKNSKMRPKSSTNIVEILTNNYLMRGICCKDIQHDHVYMSFTKKEKKKKATRDSRETDLLYYSDRSGDVMFHPPNVCP